MSLVSKKLIPKKMKFILAVALTLALAAVVSAGGYGKGYGGYGKIGFGGLRSQSLSEYGIGYNDRNVGYGYGEAYGYNGGIGGARGGFPAGFNNGFQGIGFNNGFQGVSFNNGFQGIGFNSGSQGIGFNGGIQGFSSNGGFGGFRRFDDDFEIFGRDEVFDERFDNDRFFLD